MKWFATGGLVLIIVVGVVWGILSPSDAPWTGVDDAVVKKFAESAGRPPREPYLNIAQGDVLLFFFLLAGAVGGFIAGYQVRSLFPPGRRSESDSPNV